MDTFTRVWNTLRPTVTLLLTVLLTGLLTALYIMGLDQVFDFLADFQYWLVGIISLGLAALYIPLLQTWKPEKMISRDESFINGLKAKVHNAKRVFRRFSKNYRGFVGLAVIIFFGLVALFPVFFLPSETPQYSWMEYRDMDKGPSLTHPLGLTSQGNDVLTIVVHGARPVIVFALRAAVIAVAIGGVLGALAGYMGGAVDRLITILAETILAFPSLFIMMTVLAITGNHEHRLWLIAAFGIASTIKIVRAETLTLRELDYTTAARAMGCSDLQIVFQHILVNATPVLIVQASLFSGQAIMNDAYINFLGVGGAVGWAGAISSSVGQFKSLAVYRDPWLIGSTGFCLFLLISSFNLVGDALRDALEVKAA